MKYNIFVLYGGKSVEHDVSLKSASAIINSIDRSKYNVYPVYISNEGVWVTGNICDYKIESPEDLRKEATLDLAESIARFLDKINSLDNVLIFPALHGQNGEDGTIQGFLEILDLPYVGCGVMSSSIAMDKVVSRDLFKKHGLPQANYLSFLKHEWMEDNLKVIEAIEDKIGFPLYVKPANSGSSVGINRVENSKDLISAIEEALQYDLKIIVEEELVAREMQVSVIGNENPLVSLPGEFIMERPFFDYDAKYIDGSIKPVVPANLTPETTERVRQLAVDTYKVLNCTGLTRVDIFVDEDNNIFVNEANTLPGFTPVSMTPVLWKATDGTEYGGLIEKLIQYGIDLYKNKKTIKNER